MENSPENWAQPVRWLIFQNEHPKIAMHSDLFYVLVCCKLTSRWVSYLFCLLIKKKKRKNSPVNKQSFPVPPCAGIAIAPIRGPYKPRLVWWGGFRGKRRAACSAPFPFSCQIKIEIISTAGYPYCKYADTQIEEEIRPILEQSTKYNLYPSTLLCLQSDQFNRHLRPWFNVMIDWSASSCPTDAFLYRIDVTVLLYSVHRVLRTEYETKQ